MYTLHLILFPFLVGDNVPVETTTTTTTTTTISTTTESPTTQTSQDTTTKPDDSETAATTGSTTAQSSDGTKSTSGVLDGSLEREDVAGLGVGSIVGIAVAVSIALVLLVVLATVGIVCHKKRRDTRGKELSKGTVEQNSLPSLRL